MGAENVNFYTELEETVKAPLYVRDSDLLNDAATSDVSPILEGDVDSSWQHQLNTFKQKIEELQENYDRSYLEIGRVLIQARDIYKGHGNWVRWLKENIPFSVRHSQRLIRVAEMFDDDDATLVSHLGLTSSKAYVLAKVSKNDISHFLTTLFLVGNKRKLVKDMTKRELEFVVTNFLKGKLSATDHEEVTNQGEETPRDSVEVNLEKLREALSRVIISIEDSNSDTRESWIFELEEMCKAGLDQLTSASE